MQIKDVEILTGMPRANIRYYEKEGLLNRTARNVFNYREYTEEDVEQFQRIKVLRLLEVSMEEIRLYKDDKEKLNQIIKQRWKSVQAIVEKIVDNE